MKSAGFALEVVAPALPHFRYNTGGILFALLNRLNTGLSFDPLAASRKEEHDHGDNDA
jgi:hypothetical protein